MYRYVHVTAEAPEAGITNGCEWPHVGTGNQILILYMSNSALIWWASFQPRPLTFISALQRLHTHTHQQSWLPKFIFKHAIVISLHFQRSLKFWGGRKTRAWKGPLMTLNKDYQLHKDSSTSPQLTQDFSHRDYSSEAECSPRTHEALRSTEKTRNRKAFPSVA